MSDTSKNRILLMLTIYVISVEKLEKKRNIGEWQIVKCDSNFLGSLLSVLRCSDYTKGGGGRSQLQALFVIHRRYVKFLILGNNQNNYMEGSGSATIR